MRPPDTSAASQIGSEQAVAPGGSPNNEMRPFGVPEVGTASMSVLAPVDVIVC